MDHGAVEVFAYQETLLMMALFGIAILAMIWVGFRRWLRYKERLGRLVAEQRAERGTAMERVEERLKAIERIVASGGTETVPAVDSLSDHASKRDGL